MACSTRGFGSTDHARRPVRHPAEPADPADALPPAQSVGRCLAPAVRQPRRPGGDAGPGADRGGLLRRAAAAAVRTGRDFLGRDPDPARCGPLVRYRRQRPRPAGPHAPGRPYLADGRAGRHGGQPDHRRQLWRGRRLSRRPYRRRHDALRRCALFAALHVLRHPADGVFRPGYRADLHRHRCGRMARYGAHRARPDAQHQTQGVH
jgi:hypothetical protein